MTERAPLLCAETRRSERMRQLFAEYAPQDLAALERTFLAGDPAEIVKSAHRLKGGAYTFGAMRMGDAAGEIERIARSGSVPPQAALQELEEALKTTLELLRLLPP
jgi:HPt (histidine-containing phosphotransfer) domain-containing protein